MAQSLNLKAVRSEPSQFASEFCEFYCSILQNLYTLGCREFLNDVTGELKNIRRTRYSIANPEVTVSFGDVKYEKIAVRCAYMYSYSVLNTSVAYREFSKHLEENKNENMLLQHLSSKTLRLCCLGGGAGIEAVGVSKAIHDIIWKSHLKDTNSLVDVHVTIVDICSEWKSEQSAIAKALDKNSNFFYSKRVNFHVEYFKADLFKPFENTLQSIINEADIITIVNFANSVQEKCPNDCIPKLQAMMRRVIDCMAEQCCLFMLDVAGGSVFYSTANVTSTYRSAFQMQMIKHKAYRLHPKTLKRLEGVLNLRGFSETATQFPTPLTKVSSCILIKKTVFTKCKEKKETKTEAEKKRMEKSEKEKEKNDKKKEEMEKKEVKIDKIVKKKEKIDNEEEKINKEKEKIDKEKEKIEKEMENNVKDSNK